MTYEDFMQLAKKQPHDHNQDSVFLLREYYVDAPSDADEQSSYSYKLTTGGVTICRTLLDAEHAMMTMVKEREPRTEDDDPVTVCYMIMEFPYNKEVYTSSVLNCLSARTYSADGELVERTLCAGDSYEGDDPIPWRFYGRLPSEIRYKEGDIVQIIDGENLWLGVVVSTPPTVELCWQIRQNFAKYLREKCLDGTGPTDGDIDRMSSSSIGDDNYIVVDGPGYIYHNHIPSVYVMNPTFPVPEHLQQSLREAYEFTIKELESSKVQ